jgi:crossover junction endodeoxyribonuclease RuvC
LKIIGIDPGSRATGWAVVEFAGSARLVAAGVLRPPTNVPFGDRLLSLHHGLTELVVREGPDVAAVERVFSGVNPQSLILLGEARGVLLLALAQAGVPAAEVTPAEIKKSVAGSGSAEKEQVRRMVTALLGRRLPLDAADAAAAALAHGFVVARRGAVARPAAVLAGAPRVKHRPSG